MRPFPILSGIEGHSPNFLGPIEPPGATEVNPQGRKAIEIMVVRCRGVDAPDEAIEVLERGSSEFTVKLRLRAGNYYLFVEAVKCRIHRLP
jgi:hypothetical protein